MLEAAPLCTCSSVCSTGADSSSRDGLSAAWRLLLGRACDLRGSVVSCVSYPASVDANIVFEAAPLCTWVCVHVPIRRRETVSLLRGVRSSVRTSYWVCDLRGSVVSCARYPASIDVNRVVEAAPLCT